MYPFYILLQHLERIFFFNIWGSVYCHKKLTFKTWLWAIIIKITWIAHTSIPNFPDGEVQGISNIHVAFIIHGYAFGMIETSLTRFPIHMSCVALKRPSNQSCPTICNNKRVKIKNINILNSDHHIQPLHIEFKSANEIAIIWMPRKRVRE